MSDVKAFTVQISENHRHAVVIEIKVCLSVNIAEFSGMTKIEFTTRALIDTGANRSCMSRRLVSVCNLEPISYMSVRSAQGISEANVYSVDFTLSSEMQFCNIPVMEFSGGSDFDVIIGMDILSQGDIAITNAKNQMFFSMRIPSADKHIDFTK